MKAVGINLRVDYLNMREAFDSVYHHHCAENNP